jgi:Uma2 family endonuclease
MTAKPKIKLSPETYLKQERQAEFKSEYYNGEVYAMAGASRNHNQITSNIVVSLGRQLAKLPCSVYSSDMKVRTRTADLSKYSYPDVVLSCDEELFESDKGDVLLNPQIIIEVLSDSTEAYDRGLKFFHYQLISSLQEYLLVSQHYCRVEHYQRRADKQWIYSEFHTMEESVSLATLACSLTVSEIYHRVAWETKKLP